MTITVELISVATGATLFLGILALSIFQKDRSFRREVIAASEPGARSRSALFHRLDEIFLRTRPGRSLAAAMAGAGLTWSPSGAVVLTLVAAAGMGAVVRPLMGWAGAVVAAVLIIVVALHLLKRRRAQRVDRFVAQLPELSRLLANSAEAGLSIRRGLEMAAREMDEPARSEIAQVVSELALGRSLQSGLEHLSERLPSRELGVLMQTIVIQARSGGALVKALSGISATLEERQQLRREIRTATAGATFTAVMVVGVAFGALVIMNLINPGALDQLLSEQLGIIVLVVAGVLFGLGFVLMRAVGKVEL
ncbi:type II secretion system F family protein [Bogoriella caseilytica]|uniref:Tight adherence protein B n=1 Tax=Bogoriella caseilytica TaxID=56055 RepID=A0A3N2BBN5_9MICO|nr:type II secretion system F family protein [Bogoriella caseilytica]ROR72667.1 tight adherence protein B [Bogoriella caseilytica]